MSRKSKKKSKTTVPAVGGNNRSGRPRAYSRGSVAALEIARRYSAGEALATIAADFDVCVTTVTKTAIREGRKPRPVGRPALVGAR